ncbi:hypothetical protein J4G37_11110 [Microvirga sp. 3-52]|nr:hypothetical protein [Microvirga sp. 3-52]
MGGLGAVPIGVQVLLLDPIIPLLAPDEAVDAAVFLETPGPLVRTMR